MRQTRAKAMTRTTMKRTKPFMLIFSTLILLGILTACYEMPELVAEATQLQTYDELPMSPRRAVIGLLEEPEREWVFMSATMHFDFQTGLGLRQEEWITRPLSAEAAAQVFEILATMDATEVLTPFHFERAAPQGGFSINITLADDGTKTIYSTPLFYYFFCFTDTVGDHQDPGYVQGRSEALHDILMAVFKEE